jgi:hypothetical protein
MDALGARTTHRLSAAAEWLVAALFLAATLWVTIMIVGELRPDPAVRAAPAPAPAPAASVPPSVPARAVSVPVLALAAGIELRVGQTLAAVSARLGRGAETGRQEVDQGLLGERLTRSYEFQGTGFILVFEPSERRGEPKLVAIYLP